MSFASKIVGWYRLHKRDLPWRETSNPYYIWLSEVILQQTRVSQGLAYYQRFVANYPTVAHLAAATEDQVLKDWQGLGYYSRARNLQAAARQVVDDFGGVFPREYEAIRSLKGVGDYTAAAIASLAFGLPYAVLDGNVYRVISRVFGIEAPIDTPAGKKEIMEALEAVFDRKHPAEFNQAIMEFGALHCTPRSPGCADCVLADQCLALANGRVEALPVKSKTTRIRDRYFYYLVLEKGDTVYLEKREAGDIWTGLFQFPLLETESEMPLTALENWPELQKMAGRDFRLADMSEQYKHVLSHQRLYARFLRIRPGKGFRPAASWRAVEKERVETYAVPRLIHRYLEDEDKG